jgi:hypothetical protein
MAVWPETDSRNLLDSRPFRSGRIVTPGSDRARTTTLVSPHESDALAGLYSRISTRGGTATRARRRASSSTVALLQTQRGCNASSRVGRCNARSIVVCSGHWFGKDRTFADVFVYAVSTQRPTTIPAPQRVHRRVFARDCRLKIPTLYISAKLAPTLRIFNRETATGKSWFTCGVTRPDAGVVVGFLRATR